MKEVKKARAIIIDENNNIIITKYGGIYMFPGGKLEDMESYLTALKRELNEELGINILDSDIKYFTYITKHITNYHLRYTNGVEERILKTKYYIIRGHFNIKTLQQKLTENEKNDNFQIFKFNINDLKKEILNNKTENLRNQYFKEEMLKVLERLEKYIIPNLIDMHMHSTYSDGDLKPDELIKLAYQNGIRTLAITDHDTILGNKNITQNTITKQMKIISGIELSAKTEFGRMHILGYNFDIDDEQLNEKLKELRNNSFYSVLSILNQIKIDYGIIFDVNDMQQLFNKDSNIGRPDIAKLCIKYGLCSTVSEAFDKYLINAYNEVRKSNRGISYEECIKLILEAGGIPILAHPYSLELDNNSLEQLILKMVKIGLKGIEVYHSHHSLEQISFYMSLVNKFHLLYSGGTDYHGASVKPDIEIGRGTKDNILIKKLSLTDIIN